MHRSDAELKRLANIATETTPNPVEDLLAVFIFYSQFSLILQSNPFSLVDQLRSRLFDFIENGSELNRIMNNEVHMGFMNSLKTQWNRKKAEFYSLHETVRDVLI